MTWWPPAPGALLRHYTMRVEDERRRHIHALAHVFAVFEHNGRTLATVAEWHPGSRRWYYETIGRNATEFDYWPDGEMPPAGHNRCEACAESPPFDRHPNCP